MRLKLLGKTCAKSLGKHKTHPGAHLGFPIGFKGLRWVAQALTLFVLTSARELQAIAARWSLATLRLQPSDHKSVKPRHSLQR